MVDRGRTGGVLTTIHTVAETGSTNADVLALARTGAEDGLWIRAERQTSGRGRQGRTWHSPVGNLYASTLVRLRPGDPLPATLALVAAVALQEVVSEYLPGQPAMLKWPNDLLIGGAKVSGILLERADDAVVIGFGVNLAHHPAATDRATTSLAAEGATVSPADFVASLVESLARWIGIWRQSGLGPVVTRWTERAHSVGTPLVARLADETSVSGAFDRIGPDGALILRLADGSARAIHAADVFLV